jgi:predicted outer membrane repeat protein
MRNMLVLLLLGPSPALAATLDVPGTYATIGDALRASADGDTIAVAAGTYSESIDVKKSVSIVGAGSGTTTLTGGTDVVSVTNSNTVTLSGFTIVPTGDRAFFVRNSSILNGSDIVVSGVTTSADGGVIAIRESSTATFADSTFSGIVATGRSGAHVYARNGGTLTLTRCVVEGGEASQGGAFDLDSATLTLVDTIVADNVATGNGGAIYASKSTVTISGGGFYDNGAGGSGGAYYDTSGAVAISGALFEGNYATTGGAIYWAGSTTLTVSDATFEANTATTGGAIAAAGGSLTLSDTSFVGNDASSSGGAVSTASVTSFSSTRGWYCGNQAGANGGALALSSTTSATSVASVFLENQAVSDGGAIYANGGGVTLTNNDLLGNSAATGGGVRTVGSTLAFKNNLVAWTPAGSGAHSSTIVSSSYGAFWSNASSDVAGSFSALDGNHVVTDPALTNASMDGDCANDTLWPLYGSPLIDAGDPSVLDPDGSRSDIGAYGGASAPAELFADGDSDGFLTMHDCDDAKATVNPGAVEMCDSVDNDCDGVVDGSTAIDATDWHPDADGDGFGDGSVTVRDCVPPTGYVDDG